MCWGCDFWWRGYKNLVGWMGKFSAGGGGLPSRENSVSGVFIVNSGQISYSASIVDLEQVNACWVDYCPMAKYF